MDASLRLTPVDATFLANWIKEPTRVWSRTCGRMAATSCLQSIARSTHLRGGSRSRSAGTVRVFPSRSAQTCVEVGRGDANIGRCSAHFWRGNWGLSETSRGPPGGPRSPVLRLMTIV